MSQLNDSLYTFRWYANELLKASANDKQKTLAKELIVEISKLIGDNVATETPVPSKDSSLKLALVVGHTKKDGGAYSKTLNMQEYEYNTDLANKIKAYVTTLGGQCSIHFRDVGGVKGAHAEAIKTKPTAIIELHFNSANGKASGSEVLFSDTYDKSGLKELILAQTVSMQMSSTLGIPNRGAKRLAKGEAERGLQNVSQTTTIPTILIESGFGDNPVDATAMKNKKNELARSIVDGVQQWRNA